MNKIVIIGGAVGALVLVVVLIFAFSGGDDTDVARSGSGGGGAATEQELAAVRVSGEAEEGGPAFDIVRVERDGSAVLAGRAKPGARVTIMGTVDGREEVIGEVVADSAGEWALPLDRPLNPGEVEISQLQTDKDTGQRTRSGQVVTISVPDRPDREAVVVLSQPGASTKLLQGPGVISDTGNLLLEAVDYDEDGNITLGGRSDPEAAVQAYLDNSGIGGSIADDKGRWTIRPNVEIAPRVYTLRIDQVDEAGEVVARISIPFKRATRAEILRSQAQEGEVIIQPGDNLWTISRHLYGQGQLFTVIYDANAQKIGDPNLIYPGQIFVTPDPEY